MSSAQSHCELCLRVTIGAKDQSPGDLERALERLEASCLFVTPSQDHALDAKAAAQLIEIAHLHDVAAFLQADAELAMTLGADGIHVDADLETYRKARQVAGDTLQIGVAYQGSRHDAMILAEAGADYVAFAADAERGPVTHQEVLRLIEWWSQLFEVPCVAWTPATAEQAFELAEHGADFVVLERDLWARVADRWSIGDQGNPTAPASRVEQRQ